MNLKLKFTPLMAATIASAAYGMMVTAPLAHAARPGTEYAMAVVHYDDLELSKEKDVEQLLRRVKRAARNVCTPGGVAVRYSAKAQRQCFDATLRKAMIDVERLVELPITPILARDNS
ncbi:MAG: UrcA family protein [Sphingorhabdus sp.]|nr:UrcA family protein [Sphingorhabdus sp.]